MKSTKAARVNSDNESARAIPMGTTTTDVLFGEVVLGKNLGPTDVSEGWDMYEVRHTGFKHIWSSAVVVASFGKSSGE